MRHGVHTRGKGRGKPAASTPGVGVGLGDRDGAMCARSSLLGRLREDFHLAS